MCFCLLVFKLKGDTLYPGEKVELKTFVEPFLGCFSQPASVDREALLAKVVASVELVWGVRTNAQTVGDFWGCNTWFCLIGVFFWALLKDLLGITFFSRLKQIQEHVLKTLGC